jgi:hypothetical protein
LLLLSACVDPTLGERGRIFEECKLQGAMDCESKSCPVGESCSPVAPEGLRFERPFPVDGAVALGGEEVVRIFGANGPAPNGLEIGTTTTALQIVTSSVARNGGALQVRVRGAATGGGLLRASLRGLLVDRVWIDVEKVETVELLFAPLTLFSEGPSNASVLAGRRAPLLISLRGADRHLVDETLIARAPGATQLAWYEVAVEAPAVGDRGEVEVVLGSGEVFAPSYPVAARVDDVVAVGFDRRPIAALTEPGGCFAALEGTRFVVGASWRTELISAETLRERRPRLIERENFDSRRRCFDVERAVAGAVRLRITVEGVAREWEVP